MDAMLQQATGDGGAALSMIHLGSRILKPRDCTLCRMLIRNPLHRGLWISQGCISMHERGVNLFDITIGM